MGQGCVVWVGRVVCRGGLVCVCACSMHGVCQCVCGVCQYACMLACMQCVVCVRRVCVWCVSVWSVCVVYVCGVCVAVLGSIVIA